MGFDETLLSVLLPPGFLERGLHDLLPRCPGDPREP